MCDKRVRTIWVAVIGSATLLAATATISADETAGLAGTWKVRVSSGRSSGRVSILKLRTNDDEWTGVMLQSLGSRNKLQEVEYAQGHLSFAITRQWNNRRFTLRYSATLVDDTLRGTMEYERRGQTQTVSWTATRTTPQEVSNQISLPPVAADIPLTDENYASWRDHILPESSEMAWERIPWLTTFKDGILAANATGKPLLLWTMNGHPLGCT